MKFLKELVKETPRGNTELFFAGISEGIPGNNSDSTTGAIYKKITLSGVYARIRLRISQGILEGTLGRNSKEIGEILPKIFLEEFLRNSIK